MNSTSKREQAAQSWSGNTVTCVSCGASKEAKPADIRNDEDIMPMVPCEGGLTCTAMLCESCRRECQECHCWTCAEHLISLDADNPEFLICGVCRNEVAEYDARLIAEYMGPEVARQSESALVVAMAEQAREDRNLIEGAKLNDSQARKRRSDANTPRKSGMDMFCDLFRRMTKSEQATALEVLRQIQRLGAPQIPTDSATQE